MEDEIIAMVSRWFGHPVFSVEEEIQALITTSLIEELNKLREKLEGNELAYYLNPYIDQRIAELKK